MVSKIEKYTKDGKWKVVMEAWKTYAYVYSSIGSKVTVYYKRTTNGVWGETTEWVMKNANSIQLVNDYYGKGLAGQSSTTERAPPLYNAPQSELKKWAVGLGISIPLDPNYAPAGSPRPDTGGIAELKVEGVVGHISVVIGDESFIGDVSAGTISGSSSGIW